MSIEMIRTGAGGIDGVLSLYAIPNEWAEDDDLFKSWWVPKVEIGNDGLYHIVEEARISDEAKAQRLVMPPVHNLITNAGVSRILTNQSVTTQASQQPFCQILSMGNLACSGVLRTDTSVPGDGFATGARKAPATYYTNGFLTTVVVQYGTGDGNGTWISGGWYGGGSATTTTGTGTLYSHVLFPFTKTNANSYSVNYCFLLGN